MSLIMAIVIGGIVGWLASLLTKADAPRGILANVVAGIVGSFLAISIAGALGAPVHDAFASWIVAVLGAGLLIAILKALGVFSRLAAWR